MRLFRIIGYEWSKLLSDRKILFLIFIGVFITGVTIWNICDSELPEYKYAYDFNQNTIDQIVMNAEINMNQDSDVKGMKTIQSAFSHREWNYNAYNSREKDYSDGIMGMVTGMVLAILLMVYSFDLERNSNMNLVIYTVPQKHSYVGVAKLLGIMGMGAMIQLLLFITDLVGYVTLGGINPFLHLYLVPGYLTTWYSGTILMYKLVMLLYGILFTSLLLILLYLAGLFIKDSIKLLCCGLVFLGAGYTTGILDVTGYFRTFGMIVISGHVFFKFEIMLFVLFLLTLFFFFGLLLMNRRRGRL